MLSIRFGKTQLVKRNLGVVTEVLLLPCRETCELGFRMVCMMEQGSLKSATSLLEYLTGCWKKSESTVCTTCSESGNLRRPDVFSTFPKFLKFLTHVRIVVRARADFSYHA